jgi:hypothetical protein
MHERFSSTTLPIPRPTPLEALAVSKLSRHHEFYLRVRNPCPRRRFQPTTPLTANQRSHRVAQPVLSSRQPWPCHRRRAGSAAAVGCGDYPRVSPRVVSGIGLGRSYRRKEDMTCARW